MEQPQSLATGSVRKSTDESVGIVAVDVTRTSGVATRIGTLSFTHDFANGYPTKETVEALYDERDFQRACQVYLWSLPLVSFAEWQHAGQSVIGAGDTDVVLYTTYADKLGILTATLPRLISPAFPISPRPGRS